MILRRIIAHLRKQEWTAIGIDFVIVVVGVLVGMQVTNWNADAADRRRGAEYVERLIRNMEINLATRRGEVAYYTAVLDSVSRTNALLADPRANPETLIVSAYRATEITSSAATRATWNEIVSSGDIGLLPREAVDLIAGYYARDSSEFITEILQRTDYRRRVREVIPLEIQMAMRAGCSDVRNEVGQIVGFMDRCDLDVSGAALNRAASALRATASSRTASVPILERLHSARQFHRRRRVSGAGACRSARRSCGAALTRASGNGQTAAPVSGEMRVRGDAHGDDQERVS